MDMAQRSYDKKWLVWANFREWGWTIVAIFKSELEAIKYIQNKEKNIA